MTKISELRPGQYVDLYEKLDLDEDSDERYMWDDIFALVVSVGYDGSTKAWTLRVQGYDDLDPDETYEYVFFEDIEVETHALATVVEMI